MDFSTVYLGKTLRSPLVVSANPLSDNLDNIKRMEDAGAGAIVLTSLFEEQLRMERNPHYRQYTHGLDNDPALLPHYADHSDVGSNSDAYLEHIRKAKAAVSIPIIASLNGTTAGGWSLFAKQIAGAGADALELNLYNIPSDPSLSAAEIESGLLLTAQIVKRAITIPVAVKLSPYFTNMAAVARSFDEAGLDGLVLFNRFYQPDLSLETLVEYPHILLSTAQDLRLPLHWIAALHGRVHLSLAATGGIHEGIDAIKALMVGANVVMVASALLKNGIDHLRYIEAQMRGWLQTNEYASIDELRGVASVARRDSPADLDRAQYMRALKTYLPKP